MSDGEAPGPPLTEDPPQTRRLLQLPIGPDSLDIRPLQEYLDAP